MNTYRICMKVEQDVPAGQDMEIIRVVQADSDLDAANKAMLSVRLGNPSINAAKIWASSREWIRSSSVIDALQDEICSTQEICAHA